MEDAWELLERLDGISGRVEQADRSGTPLEELEDVLTAGYAGALAGEAHMMKLEQRLDHLLDRESATRADELRSVVREHRSLERSVARLRSMLPRLQARFVALGGAAARHV